MIKLENISTENLMVNPRWGFSASELDEYIHELLYVYDISDYQQLKDFIATGNPDLSRKNALESLIFQLHRVERLVKKENSLGTDVDVYSSDIYREFGLDNSTIKATDDNNKGSVLLYNSPLLKYGYRVGQIKDLSISEIKYLLSHVESYYLKNLLSCKREFGPVITKRIYDSVRFYEDQVIRQTMETEQRGIDLFSLNKEVKDEIVESEIKDIIEYIVDTGEVAVWGKLTDTEKKMLMAAAISTKGYYIQRDRSRLIDTISNYTTLSELEKGVVKTRTLDRFIVKKR